MRIDALDHVFAETPSWDDTRAFTGVSGWGSEGHRFGRPGNGTTGRPDVALFFDLTDGTRADVHRITRWPRIIDPDGQVHALEETT